MFLFVELSIQCEEAIEILRAIPDATTSKTAYTPNGIIPGTLLLFIPSSLWLLLVNFMLIPVTKLTFFIFWSLCFLEAINYA